MIPEIRPRSQASLEEAIEIRILRGIPRRTPDPDSELYPGQGLSSVAGTSLGTASRSRGNRHKSRGIPLTASTDMARLSRDMRRLSYLVWFKD